MNESKPARTTDHDTPRLTTLITTALTIAALFGVLGHQVWMAPDSLATHDTLAATAAVVVRQADDARRRDPPRDRPPLQTGHGDSPGAPGAPGAHIARAGASAPGEADGAVPAGVTVFDDDVPAVANLNPDLLGVLRRAATDAASAGISFYVNSGWRSPAYQEHLLREAIIVYGSEEEAARWVATADTSAHVRGEAIDLGPDEAIAWLSANGAGYGLCQIYANEPWHVELRPESAREGCPPMYADPTHDPRMRP